MSSKLLLVAGAAATLSLAACTGRISEADAGPRPVNYRATLRQYIVETFFDPYSMMDVAVSEPVPGTVMLHNGWIVCFQANAKNRFGAYSGLQRSSYLFQGENLTVDPDGQALACNGVPLQPWPGMRLASLEPVPAAPPSPPDPNRRPSLGVHTWPAEVYATAPGLAGDGIALSGVDGNSPASRAGIRPGDHILVYDGHPVKSPTELKALIDRTALDKPVPIEIKRGDERMTVNVSL